MPSLGVFSDQLLGQWNIQGSCWACSSRIWGGGRKNPHNPKTEPPPPSQPSRNPSLTVGGLTHPLCLESWGNQWENTTNVGLEALLLEEAAVTGRRCSLTSAPSNYLSFKCSRRAMFVCCTQRRILGDFWWYMILWDLTTLFWPCGCCRGLHHLQKFPPLLFLCDSRVGGGGEPSDGWWLDWCVCRKWVNNINFIWINKKTESGSVHKGFSVCLSWHKLVQKLNFWGKKSDINPSFELTTPILLTVRAPSRLILRIALHSGCSQSCKRQQWLQPANFSGGGLACASYLCRISAGAGWSLSLRGKTDTVSEARYGAAALMHCL